MENMVQIETPEQAKRLHELLAEVEASEMRLHEACASPSSHDALVEAVRREDKAVAEWQAYRQSLIRRAPVAFRI